MSALIMVTCVIGERRTEVGGSRSSTIRCNIEHHLERTLEQEDITDTRYHVREALHLSYTEQW